MIEEISKSKVASLLDRVHEARLPVTLLALIISADVGLLLTTQKSILMVISDGNIMPLQLFCIVLSIIAFLLFNSLLAFFSRVFISWFMYLILKPDSENKNPDNFTVGESLIYAIKYNNKVLENVYLKHVQQNNNKRQLKNVMFSLFLFIGIDICYASSLIRQIPLDNALGVLYVFLLPDVSFICSLQMMMKAHLQGLIKDLKQALK